MNNKLLKMASFSPNSLSFPNSWVGHMPFAAFLVEETRPKILVELGTHTGNSYFAFCQSVASNNIDTKCYSVDTWAGDEHAGSYDEEVYEKVFRHNEQNYKQFSKLMRMTFDEALNKFEDNSIDLLHIDGLHTYEAVKHDFETWLPKLASGALVLFHDTQVFDRGFGVYKLWQELTLKYPNNIEFEHSYGLGVIQILNRKNSKKIEWLESRYPYRDQLKNYFSALGNFQMSRFNEMQLQNELVNKDDQIRRYHEAALNKDEHINDLENQLSSIFSSRIWRLNLFFRAFLQKLKFWN